MSDKTQKNNKRGKRKMAVSMGVLPVLTKEQGKLLKETMKKSRLKEEQIEGCGKRLKKIIKEQGL